MVDYREVVIREMAKINFTPESGEAMKEMFDVVYPELKKKYDLCKSKIKLALRHLLWEYL